MANPSLHKLCDASLEGLDALALQISQQVSAGDVIFLQGDLGTGKTTFTKYLAHHCGVRSTVSSPTFSILNVYVGDKLELYHFDLYRLKYEEELLEIGLEEARAGLSVIEWPDLARGRIVPSMEIIFPHLRSS